MFPRPALRDGFIALAFLGWALVEIAVHTVTGSVAVTASSAVLATVPLAWRKTAPASAALLCAGGLVLKTALGLRLDGLALLCAMLVAAYSVGRHRAPRVAAATVGTMIVLAWLSLFGLPAADQSATNYPFVALWVGAPGIAGAALQARIAQAERFAARATRAEVQREEHARLAVETERGRLARELHDTVAHAVSVMVLHTGAVRSRLPAECATEQAALERIEEVGRRAIAELHHLLGILRSDIVHGAAGLPGTEPQPTLAQLDGLVDETRRHGLAVEFTIDGVTRPLEPAVEVSAYRIVQEALTNVRKHADATAVSVRLAYDDEWLRLRISDNGVGIPAGEGAGDGGFGLVGMRERVEVYGGTLALSSPEGGGFTVDAALPVGRDAGLSVGRSAVEA